MLGYFVLNLFQLRGELLALGQDPRPETSVIAHLLVGFNIPNMRLTATCGKTCSSSDSPAGPVQDERPPFSTNTLIRCARMHVYNQNCHYCSIYYISLVIGVGTMGAREAIAPY